MPGIKERIEPLTILFEDDGLVPNSPLPLLIYKHAIDVDNAHPERTIEELFGSHGWGDMWRNGIYDYPHYHSTAHEALGVARGRALVRFGGDHGTEIGVSAGDVAILPAGTGHQCMLASRDLSVVGAYPRGQKMEIARPTAENHARALRTIPKVGIPDTDPLVGVNGPLVRLWKQQPSR
jgi:uncharacterized protein YjlB